MDLVGETLAERHGWHLLGKRALRPSSTLIQFPKQTAKQVRVELVETARQWGGGG